MAHYFEWLDDYSVGVSAFDEEHKRLLALADRMVEALQNGTAQQEVGGVLDALIEYAVQHFEHEERVMAQTDYPGLQAHKNAHYELLRKVLRFRFAEQHHTLQPVDVAEFLLEWVLTHIREEDKQYGPHLNAHGIT